MSSSKMDLNRGVSSTLRFWYLEIEQKNEVLAEEDEYNIHLSEVSAIYCLLRIVFTILIVL